MIRPIPYKPKIQKPRCVQGVLYQKKIPLIAFDLSAGVFTFSNRPKGRGRR